MVTQGSFLYWADPIKGTIGRAEISGGGVSGVNDEFIAGLGSPRWLAADCKYLYWTDLHEGNEGEGTIGRVELNGENPKPDFIEGLNRPQGVAVDSEHVYWAAEGAGKSNRRGLDRQGGNRRRKRWKRNGVNLTANETSPRHRRRRQPHLLDAEPADGGRNCRSRTHSDRP